MFKSKRGKEFLGLLEEAPRSPRMRGLPKVHNQGIPMRHITSGIGSAPHRLANCLARLLSSALGKISGAQLNNSTDTIERLKHVDFEGKMMARFDVKDLLTNIIIDGAINAVRKALDNVSDSDLFSALCEICISMF